MSAMASPRASASGGRSGSARSRAASVARLGPSRVVRSGPSCFVSTVCCIGCPGARPGRAPVSYRTVRLESETEKLLRRLRRPHSLASLKMPLREGALPAQVRILGLDPGSQRTGYAVIDANGAGVAYVVSGAIRTNGESMAERLQQIFLGVDRLVSEFRPDEVAIERVFMHRNADSALKLGQARGAALSATFTVRPRVFEYAPREVKLAVVGTGA